MKNRLTHSLACLTSLSLSMLVTGAVARAQTGPTLDNQEWALVSLIDNFRAQNGLGSLQVSVDLENAAQWMSNDMATHNYYSHTDSLGRDPAQRMAAFGYTYSPVDEDLAATYSDAQDTFSQLVNTCDPDSTGACTYGPRQRLLNPAYKVCGIARAYNANSSYLWYWTIDLGAVVDQTITQGGSPTIDISVTPNSGSGSTATLTYVYSDSNGYTDIADADATIGASGGAANSCSIEYVRSSNSLYLLNDAGTGLLGPLTPGSTGTVSNSQCTLNASGSLASGSGNNLTVKLNLTFTAAFAGAQSNFGLVKTNGGQTTGWQNVGSWTVPGSTSGKLAIVSLTPNSGSGSSAAFTYVYNDPKGYTDIRYVESMIDNNGSGANACWPLYFPAQNAFYLFDDSGNNYFGPVTPGSSGTLSNSQCTLNASGSSAVGSGDTLTVKVNLTFKPAFDGYKWDWGVIGSDNGQVVGWQLLGSWTVQ